MDSLELIFGTILPAILIVVGAVFALLAAVGVLRLPDVYTRMHAASKAGTVGSGLLLLGVGLHSGDPAVFLRAVAGGLFLLFTAPIAAHLLAKAAHQAGYRLSGVTVLDQRPRSRDDNPAEH